MQIDSISSSVATLTLEVRRTTPSNPWTYRDLNLRQREIAARIESGGLGAVLLSEVAPIITLGRRTPISDLTGALELGPLSAASVDRMLVDRGGLATYHGPGQWVLFIVERLDRLTGDTRGVRQAVEGLLQVGQKVAQKFDPDAEIRRGGEWGVWNASGKLASVGIHIERGVLLHGVAVNVVRTPESFRGLLRPCGLDAQPAFLLSSPGADSFDRVGRELLNAIPQVFNVLLESVT